MSTRTRRVAGLGGLLAVAALLLPAVAAADNRRVSISNYQWSDTEIELDRGEHVTWYWIGPDTMHSITGVPPEAAGIDSDPQTSQPRHDIGDTFRLDFDQPGTFEFQCKLHSTVRGVITVSNRPGDPRSEPDPIPQSQVDLESPHMRDVRLDSASFRAIRGTKMRYGIDERAKIEVEYFRRKRKGGTRFAGYSVDKKGHVGLNSLRFGKRSKSFKARPGRYLARVVAVDGTNNRTRPTRLSFRIWGGKRSTRH